jgi:hypothetical protein
MAHTGLQKLRLVMRGLDPRIHRLKEELLSKFDGLPGRARQ